MKSIYKFVVTETVKKYVEVEAETQEEAEEIAANEDMDKNYDSYDREVTLLGATSLESINGYPKYINGWNLEYADNMTYWKKADNYFRAVCLMWLDTVEGDEGYNPEHDSWVIIEAYGDTIEEAFEALDIMPWSISDVMPRKDVEYTMIEWFKSQEG